MFSSPYTWILLSAIIFSVVAVKKGRGPILGMLDARSARIKAELAEAERLKAEAQALLEECKRKEQEAVYTARKIVENAEGSVADIHRAAEKKLSENIQRHEKFLLERIAQAENAALQELRARTADLATAAAEKLLTDTLEKRSAQLVEESIVDLQRNALN